MLFCFSQDRQISRAVSVWWYVSWPVVCLVVLVWWDGLVAAVVVFIVAMLYVCMYVSVGLWYFFWMYCICLSDLVCVWFYLVYLYAGIILAYVSWVRLGYVVIGPTISVVDHVVDFSSLLLLYDSLLGNEALTSLSLPTSLVTILGYAFYGCSALRTVIIPT